MITLNNCVETQLISKMYSVYFCGLTNSNILFVPYKLYCTDLIRRLSGVHCNMYSILAALIEKPNCINGL